MLAQHLSHIDFLDEAMAQLDQQIAMGMRPFAAAHDVGCLAVNQRIAEIIVAEIGADLAPFEDALTTRFLGRYVSGQPRECRQTQEWPHAQRQSVAAAGTD